MKGKKKDIMRESFDQIMQRLGITGSPKPLLKNGEIPKEFEANGNKYCILPLEKAFNFDRQLAYFNLDTAFALMKTPQEIMDSFLKVYHNQIRLMQANTSDWQNIQDENLRDCINFVDGMKGEYTQRLPSAYFICTLFMIKEGEDLNVWNWEMAIDKIADWKAENLSPTDFFSLALHFATDSTKNLIQNLKDT